MRSKGRARDEGNALPEREQVTRVTEVDENDILERVASLPISTWVYKDDPSVRHLGPMAQDFRAAFDLGEDAVTIDIRDEVNVALAAIKALYRIVQEQQAEIERLSRRMTELERLHADGSRAASQQGY